MSIIDEKHLTEGLRVGQKIHPTGFRLGIVQEHRSRWFADSNRYPQLLKEDHIIREYVEKNLSNAGISDIRIERKADQIDLEVRTARPGVVVGRGGSGIEALRLGLQQALKDSSRQIRINVVEVTRVDADAPLVAEYITQQLERRVAFRRVVRQALQRAQRAGVEGIKIQVSGRLNGAEIARTEWTREGRVPASYPTCRRRLCLPDSPNDLWCAGCQGLDFPRRGDSWSGRSAVNPGSGSTTSSTTTSSTTV
jgi:small subunit ribosomal protein S3